MALKPASTFAAVRSPIADPQTGAASWEWVKKFQEWELKLQNGLDKLGQAINISDAAVINGRTGTIATALQHIDGTGTLSAAAITGVIASASIPQPSVGGLGGVEASNPVPHEWVNSIDAAGVPQLSQPDYGDLTGRPTLPATVAAVSHKWLKSYNAATGAFAETQPDYSDLTGTPTGASGTVTLAALTGPGAQGSITFVNGLITAVVNPT